MTRRIVLGSAMTTQCRVKICTRTGFGAVAVDH